MVHTPKPPNKLSSTSRFRFAPSPTGSLHIGGLRTALYNHLLARKSGGKWILRIEDTDQTRKVEGAVDSLRRSLDWAGLDYDQGPGRSNADSTSYVQSERIDLYRQHAQRLIDTGRAYRCFCTPSELDAIRISLKASGSLDTYDRRGAFLTDEEVHRKMKAGEKHVVRLKSDSSPVPFTDLVYGGTEVHPTSPIDDVILLKSDGFPTYHLASVVDDHLMGITHVLRGEEWMPSVNKHLQIYNAFGWERPEFAHLPLLINADGTKLSKRTGSVSVEDYIKAGYEPSALNNFIALMGWNARSSTPSTESSESSAPASTESNSASHESDSDFFTMPALIDKFDLSHVTNHAAQLNLGKLDFLQKLHVSYNWEHGGVPERSRMIGEVKEVLEKRYPDNSKVRDENLIGRMIESERIRLTFLKDIAENDFLFESPSYEAEESIALKAKMVPQYREIILAAHAALSSLPPTAFASLPPQLTTSKLVPSSLPLSASSPSSDATTPRPAYDSSSFSTPSPDPIMSALNSLPMPASAIPSPKSASTKEASGSGLLEGQGKKKQLARGKMWTPLRWALTGKAQGPSVRASIGFLGREETLRRLEIAAGL